MPFYTKTGKMTKADAPRRKSFFERWWRGAWLGYLFNVVSSPFAALIFWRTREVEARLEEQETPAEPWHGLPEADLTDEQEQEAQRRAANEWHHQD